MKKKLFISMLLLFIFSIFLPITSIATSWVELEPEEVIKRSSVIVQGKYDFSKKRRNSDFIWVGYDFKVDSVYKGNAKSTMIVGVDVYDTGWIDDIQKSNGSLVLFLEQTDNAEFLTPVGGPNGMIQIRDGEIQNANEYKKQIFSNYLNNTVVTPPTQSMTNRYTKIQICIIIACSLLLGSIIIIKIKKRK